MGQNAEAYLISVVILVSGRAEYLHSIMKCVLNQTLPLGQIQMILVHGGSADDSRKACEEYAGKYREIFPMEVLPVEVPGNPGADEMRKTGLSAALGKYVTFMDDADLWSLDAFRLAAAYLERHEKEIEAVRASTEFFGEKTGKHPSWSHGEDCIADMHTEYQRTVAGCAGFIIKTEAARLCLAEEKEEDREGTVFIHRVLFGKMRYGRLPGAVYYERIPGAGRGGMPETPEQYVRIMDEIRKAAERKQGKNLPMVQYLAVYMAAWLLTGREPGSGESLTEAGEKCLNSVLRNVEDQYISEYCGGDEVLKTQLMAVKHQFDCRAVMQNLKQETMSLTSGNVRFARIRSNFDILKIWFAQKQQGRSLLPYFRYFSWSRIAVYGMSDLGRFLCEELKGTDVAVQYVIDRRADDLEAEIPVYLPEGKLPAVDVIVVTAVHFYEEIWGRLRELTDCPVISLEDMVHAME